MEALDEPTIDTLQAGGEEEIVREAIRTILLPGSQQQQSVPHLRTLLEFGLYSNLRPTLQRHGWIASDDGGQFASELKPHQRQAIVDVLLSDPLASVKSSGVRFSVQDEYEPSSAASSSSAAATTTAGDYCVRQQCYMRRAPGRLQCPRHLPSTSNYCTRRGCWNPPMPGFLKCNQHIAAASSSAASASTDNIDVDMNLFWSDFEEAKKQEAKAPPASTTRDFDGKQVRCYACPVDGCLKYGVMVCRQHGMIYCTDHWQQYHYPPDLRGIHLPE